ncbi:MAG: PorV/PorQ family protein [candidate division KSB1 bacterium]|nr:PorV/PorQ family protein [candidate division KSB1 bacterium]
MRYKGFIAVLLTGVLLLSSATVFAGTGKRIATAGATELLIPVGARSTALSGANTAGVFGIDAIYWNPAGVAMAESNTEAMFSHQNWIGDIDVNYLAVATQVSRVGAIGLSLKTLSFGDIMETTVTNPEGTGKVFSPTYLTVGLTYSRKMTDRILFGATAKLVTERIMSTGAQGVGFDFGLQYVSPVSGLKLGVVLTNFGTNMKFIGTDLERRVIMPGTEAGTVQTSVSIPTASFDLPSQLKLGVSYALNLGEQINLDLMGAFVNNAYAYDQYIAGAELSLRDFLFLRGAYSLAFKEGLGENESGKFVSASEDYLFGPSFGLGVKFNVGFPVTLDYAYRLTEFFNNAQFFCLTVGF